MDWTSRPAAKLLSNRAWCTTHKAELGNGMDEIKDEISINNIWSDFVFKFI